MKHYSYNLNDSILEINKTIRRIRVEKMYVILQILILSSAISAVSYYTLEKKLEISWKSIVIFLIAFLILTLFFGSDFRNKNLIIRKNEDSLEINKQQFGSISEVSSIICEEYVSAEAITGITKIKLKFPTREVTILKGVNEDDLDEILELLKGFLNSPEIQVIKKVT